jgi:hypothetical protein
LNEKKLRGDCEFSQRRLLLRQNSDSGPPATAVLEWLKRIMVDPEKAAEHVTQLLLLLLAPAVLMRVAPSDDAVAFGEIDEQAPLLVGLDRIPATVRHAHPT